MGKIRKSANGEECLLRLFPYCEHSGTVVFCHLPTNGSGGMGIKSPDFWGVYGCRTCHDIIDGRCKNHNVSTGAIQLAQWRGLFLTQQKLIDKGLLSVRD